MIGTLVNTGSVIVGSMIGLLLHARLPQRYTRVVFQAIGLFTLFVGVAMALKTSSYLILIFSLTVGSIIGEWINLDKWINLAGEGMRRKLKFSDERFSDGLVTAFLLFCMGSMTVLGAFEEGLGNKPNLLLAKSLMDGMASIALASAFGIGVLFAAIPLLIYQSALTFFASGLGNLLTESMVSEITATGGVMMIGLAFGILEIKKIRVINMLPSLFLAILFTWLAIVIK
jgi:uncharacterized protein